MNITFYDKDNLPTDELKVKIIQFLHQHLEQWGDAEKDIEKAVNYSLSINNKPGGLITIATIDKKIACAIIMNKTNMSGYIPENILVYIATHQTHRGKGIGQTTMQKAIENVDGDIALHVEANNPAKHLYEKLGFTNPYLEMRLKKNQ